MYPQKPPTFSYPPLPGEGPPQRAGPSGPPQQPYMSYSPATLNSNMVPTPPPPNTWSQQPQQSMLGPPMHMHGIAPPVPALQTQAQGSVSAVRVRLADEYRIDPPIPIPHSLAASIAGPSGTGSKSSTASVSLDLERDIIEGARSSAVEAFFKSAQPNSYQDPGIKQFTDMGYTHAQAALGLAYCNQAKLSQSEVADFADNYGQLMSMGYSPAIAAGALVRCKNDLNAATEMCMQVS